MPSKRWLAALLALALAVSARASSFDEDEPLEEFNYVTCGSSLKLKHVQTHARLHSHDIAYGSGSGQQSVTGYTQGDDSNSLWVVRGGVGPQGAELPCPRGSPVRVGQPIRLLHSGTGKWLHSHGHRSPLSNQQEVSCYGSPGESNSNDNWVLELVEGSGDQWERALKVRLRHVDTGVYLWSHNKQYPRPIQGQLEVCGASRKGHEAEWTAAEGVYFSSKDEF